MSKKHKHKSNSDIIISGYWDGLPIWRRRTAAERMQVELDKAFKTKQPK